MNEKLIYALLVIVLAMLVYERQILLRDLVLCASFNKELRQAYKGIELRMTNVVTVLQMEKKELKADLELANLKLDEAKQKLNSIKESITFI
jgi:hypothetical protein